MKKDKVKKPHRGLRIFLTTIISFVCLIVLVWASLFFSRFIIYSEFYGMRDIECVIPGINDGFVPQGIAKDDSQENAYFVSGYMNDHSCSRLYYTNEKEGSYYVKLIKEDKEFYGHCGGIAYGADHVYIASGSKIYPIAVDSIYNSGNGDKLDVGNGIKVNNSASFVFVDETYLYVGEFHDGGKYVTNNIFETSKGTNHAIVSKYNLSDINNIVDNLNPIEVISIPNKVQGFAVLSDGRYVLSTSYGLSSSHIYIYSEKEDIKQTLSGTPVYALVDCDKDIIAPAMCEDLDADGNKIYSLTESACDKYIFGKLFTNANKIFSLTLQNEDK